MDTPIYYKKGEIDMNENLEQIELFSLNKITWLKKHGLKEIDRKIHINKDKKGRNKYVVSYIFPATQDVEDLLVEYKYDSDLQAFLTTFKEVNSEIFTDTMNYIQENMM